MPQGRIVLKAICQSKKIASLKSDGARLLYTWLIPNVDINGCFSGDAAVVNGQVFTRLKKSHQTVRKYLQELAEAGLIILYEADSDIFLHIPDFVAKQPSLNPSKEAESTIPMPTPEQLQSNSRVTPRKVKESKAKQSKEKVKTCFLEFVFLTDTEYQKLVEKFGLDATVSKIAELNDAVGSKGYKYKSHYHTILNWDRRRVGEKPTAKIKLFPIAGKTCSKRGCSMPAVYKYVPEGGTYEEFRCAECMPASVKEKYS